MALGENRKHRVAECWEGARARKYWPHTATWEAIGKKRSLWKQKQGPVLYCFTRQGNKNNRVYYILCPPLTHLFNSITSL